MPIVNMPSQNVYAQLAGAQAFGQTQQMRDDQRFATQVNQRDRHFYDSMANDNAQMQFRTEAARQMAAENDYRQADIQRKEFVARIKDEQENTDWQYTKEQERRIKQIDEAEQHFKRMVANDPQGWDEQSVRDVEWQMFQERNNIRPQPRPKPDPFKDMQSVTHPETGKTFKIIPGAGRNGKPVFFSPEDPFAMDPQEEAELKFKAQLEEPKLQLDQQRQQLDAIKVEQTHLAHRERLAVDLAVKLTEMQMEPGMKPGTPKYSPEQIKEAEKRFAAIIAGLDKTAEKPPVPVGSVEQAMTLPPNTKFVLPNGKTGTVK